MITRVVSLSFLFASASAICAADPVDEKCGCFPTKRTKAKKTEKISKEEWRELQPILEAVCAKHGRLVEEWLGTTYRPRSIALVKDLAVRFDSDWYKDDMVLYREGHPTKMIIMVDGQKYYINAPVAERIILDERERIQEQML